MILKFLSMEYNINILEITLFIFAGGTMQFGYRYYIVFALLALGSMMYRDYHRQKLHPDAGKRYGPAWYRY